jgi:uncharacterized protein
MKVKLHVVPNSSENKICGLYGDALKIKVKAPPVDGKANKEIVKVLAELIDVPTQDIEILHGSTGQKKLVEINLSPQKELDFKKKYLSNK